MSNLPAPPRRLAIAIAAAVASTTLAVGVSVASLMGWFAPALPASSAAAEPAASPPVILVPITPSAPAIEPAQPEATTADLQVAMDERPRRHEDDSDRGERHEHDDRDEDDDE